MKGQPLNEALYEYIVEHFASPERKLLEKMSRAAQDAGMPMIMVSEDQARFLKVLVAATGAKRALDVGTLFGYSAAVLAQALPRSGRVVSLEVREEHAKVARENLERLRLGAKVDVRVGPALDSMRGLESKSFDLVLIDADKEGYVDYFEESLRLVRRGGLILADNTLAWGRVADPPATLREDPRNADVLAIQRFNDRVMKEPRVEASLLPLGDGLLVAYVKE